MNPSKPFNTKGLGPRRTFTSRQVADAIGVSESSVKRWCDDGTLETERTGGGHRRISLEALLQYLKRSGRPLADPELLGLPGSGGRGRPDVKTARRQLRDALIAGNENASRQLLFDLFLTQPSLAAVFDDVLAPIFHEIGEMWNCGSVEVYQERQSCLICLRILHELRVPTAPLDPTAPLAIGGTLAGDNYQLATTMVELVLRSAGWNAVLIGTGLPAETIATAVATQRPRLLWLSVSDIDNPDTFCARLNELFELCKRQGTLLVLGGQMLTSDIRRRIQYSAFCDTMRHLEAIAGTFLQSVHADDSRS